MNRQEIVCARELSYVLLLMGVDLPCAFYTIVAFTRFALIFPFFCLLYLALIIEIRLSHFFLHGFPALRSSYIVNLGKENVVLRLLFPSSPTTLHERFEILRALEADDKMTA